MTKLVITSDLFKWYKDLECFTVDASDIEAEKKRQGRPRLGWDYHRGNRGFWMRSEKTGREIWFGWIESLWTDGEATSDRFACSEPDLMVDCIVYND